ncbi:MAG: hypothetical protein NTY50_00835 [Methylobacter sp.]|nr:hypothetical protein [Methylobacter sp.]
MNPAENPNESLPKNYLSLKSGKANKTGQRSEGKLHYRILTDESQQHIYLTITGNDGGGYYSKEIVPFEKVELCLQGIKTGEAISSKLFKNAFVGQSANNAGFLAAILRAEKLLLPVADSVHQHALQPNWSEWKTEVLALTDQAESYQPEPPKARIGKASLTKNQTGDKDEVEAERDTPDSSATDNAELDEEEMQILQRNTLDTDISEQDEHELEITENITTVAGKKPAKKRGEPS